MKIIKSFLICCLSLSFFSCKPKDTPLLKQLPGREKAGQEYILPLDKGFSQYIASFTSGIIPANSAVEIQFTPEFAEKASQKTPTGLFAFSPAIKGKTEWKDETTLIFTPSKILDPGKSYKGELNLSKLADVEERLKIFPLRIQTLRKDFSITTGLLECPADRENTYILNGELVASDFIPGPEAESYLEVKLGKKKMNMTWDHSGGLIHKFTIPDISRTDRSQELVLSWDGKSSGVKQKGSSSINIPSSGEFSVLDVKVSGGENPRIDIVLSDPADPDQDLEGLVYLDPLPPISVSSASNIVSLLLPGVSDREVTLNIESSLKNYRGTTLSSNFSTSIDFTAVNPGIMFTGDGVILPASHNLIFPFKAANLKAVDLKIIKIFEKNLPYFLQENDIDGGYYLKRFGRPVFAGRIDLINSSATGTGTWKLYTIDLADYIDVEPGVLYKIQLSMRRSYSICACESEEPDARYDELLDRSMDLSRETWDDIDNYYEGTDEYIYYDYGFHWEDRDDPCKEAFYSPDKNISRNILASNLGLIAKRGEDGILHMMVNDLITALPVNEASIEVYDYQMQLIESGISDQDGSASIYCSRKPFLIIVKKDKDRNYLKVNDGASLSLSSFDVSGTKPEKGIKAFIYGERDVWRPGDSIFLSVFIKDMKNDIPPDHPVQFELINPLEQRVDNQIHKQGGKSLLVIKTKTAADAVTGNYTARFSIGGASFTKRIRIETIKPNRLKIDLKFPSDILGGSVSGATGSLNVKWLNGSTARNLRTSVEYILKPAVTQFERYSQYVFDDPVGEFWSETVNVFNNTIDENGNATVRFDPGKDLNAPGMLNVLFTVKVQEQGGDESIIQSAYKYAPYPVFAGINLPGLKGKNRMLYTDQDIEVKIVTVDEKGKPVRSKVEMTVYKLSYRWWWESDNENLAYYISNRIYKPIAEETISTTGGEGSFTFNISKNNWGRYLVRATTPEGHSTGKIILVDWPWEYGMKAGAEGATLLAVSTDREKYNPGDEVKLSFPSPENARAIITIENATGIIDEIRVPASKENTEVKFKATPEMAPNVYAYVSVIQPHSQSINDMPVRLYGIVPVMVEDPGTRLSPEINMPDEVRSQKSFQIKVSEANRNPMNYTLAVVDEGLLDITGFGTPDPWNYFYSREALGVQTWDIYDYVLGAFGGTLEKLFAVGGDEAVVDKSANKAQRFVPVVKFLGPFELGAGKTNSHIITLPQYTGSVRTMVIAGTNRAFGTASKSVLVKDPLMVLVTAPRVISPGDETALPVTVFIQKEGIRDITLKTESNDLVRFKESSLNLTSVGTGEKNAEFSLIAGEKTGVARIKVTASGGGETAVYNLELEVRSPNPPETRAELKVMKPGEKWEISFTPFGIEGSNSARIEMSTLPSINLGKKLQYLLDYPHGCSEQVTSCAFPQLWLKNIIPDDAAVIKQSSDNVREAVNRLISRQMINGGIAMWPGSYQADNWITSYAGHFMIEAERMGYNITSGFRQKWVSYQKKTAQEWRFDPGYKQSANDQAYRLFTLALAGQPEKGAMNRLRETTEIPNLAKWFLAAAYAITGRPEAADELIDMRNLEPDPEYCNYYYGSQVRDKSIILYTLTLLKKEDQALVVLKEICDDISRDAWYSTQSLSWGLFSYMKWIDMIPTDSQSQATVSMNLNGDKTNQVLSKKKLAVKDLKISVNNTLILENTSQAPVYANLVRKGIPLRSDATLQEKGISMKIEYRDMDLKPISHTRLAQGSDFMMVVKATNSTFTRIENVALTQMVPSGWEILNTRLFEGHYGIKESSYDYRDFRDDRVNTYFTLSGGETKTFVLILNAAYKGTYFQPAVWCEAMYTENFYSRLPGTTISVTGN